jgi:Nucleotidyl transferase AbiEii toxin, Type IV TA system
MARDNYNVQVELLVNVLPFIAREAIFALKGGTAINLFYRDMPRLSVDIDLTYLPIEDRKTSLADIDAALNRVQKAIRSELSSLTVDRIRGGDDNQTRLLVRRGTTQVKIETSPVMRGTLYAPALKSVTANVQNRFGFAEINVLAFEDLYGGKLHAAVDRQHPRDLFDVKILYENEGVTESLFRAFLVYIGCSGRPPHELLRPNLIELEQIYQDHFEGMTTEPVNLADLKATRVQLIEDIKTRLDDKAARFLLSLHDGEPDFNVINLPQAHSLPAIRWKIQNLQKLKTENPAKHADQRALLEALL